MTAPTVTIADRVAAGATYLDEHEPGWWKLIELGRLNLASGCRCVLGQLEMARTGDPWSNYCDAVDRLGLADSQSAALGFECSPGGVTDYDYEARDAEYAELTVAWRELIEKRRAGAA